MRLICPNCGAQYEVPDEVIPEAGRDVQCSSCGHTWFQAHPDFDRERAEDLGEAVPDEDWTPPPEEADPDEAPETDTPEPASASDDDAPVAAETDPSDANVSEANVSEAAPSEATVSDSTVSETTPPDTGSEPGRDAGTGAATAPGDTSEQAEDTTQEPPRRRLDPAVADLLREEAEHEARARRAEAEQGLESQPEFALQNREEATEGDRRAREARNRLARMKNRDPDTPEKETAEAEETPSSSRRDLLPDIDEINSTLRSGSERRASAVERAERAQKAGAQRNPFRRGFVVAVAIFALAALAYAYSAEIAQAVPQLEPVLEPYVVWVNDLRQWLNVQIGTFLVWLDGMAQNSGG